MMKNIAVFASGNGTNAENLIRFSNKEESLMRVTLVVTNRLTAGVRERAADLDVSCLYIPKEMWKEGTEIRRCLWERGIDFIVLAGFLVRIPDILIEAYPQRIVNIHPALLPKFGGKGMYGDHVHRAVVEAGETESGITIHYINEHYDEGTIIAQFRCPVYPADTPDDVARRVHALEYEHYPQVVARLVGALQE